MTLTLYMHPLASFCHKVLIALYEKQVPFVAETVDLMDPGAADAFMATWPVGKIPVLRDASSDRVIPETSIIIEYLDQRFPNAPLLPADPDRCLQARLWDRFFDNYVSLPMQKIVLDRIRPPGQSDAFGVDEARRSLDTAYAMIDRQLDGCRWAIGDDFTIADCAAAPGLFFASIVHPFPPDAASLAAYFERLLERPSFARTLSEARPWFEMFPYRDAMPERFVVS
jgi:glutathione S-transferase